MCNKKLQTTEELCILHICCMIERHFSRSKQQKATLCSLSSVTIVVCGRPPMLALRGEPRGYVRSECCLGGKSKEAHCAWNAKAKKTFLWTKIWKLSI